MGITKGEANQDKRNNPSSPSCHTCSFTNISRNNNSNTIWGKWNNKNGTKSKR